MGLYNYLQGDKLLRDTLLLHKDIGPYERAVFSYLCLNTPDPQSPLPFVFRAANEYGPVRAMTLFPFRLVAIWGLLLVWQKIWKARASVLGQRRFAQHYELLSMSEYCMK